jgi:hypothetical protein
MYVYTCINTHAFIRIHKTAHARAYEYEYTCAHAVEAIEDIQAGEEILADYGERYWLVLAGICMEHQQVEEHVKQEKCV